MIRLVLLLTLSAPIPLRAVELSAGRARLRLTSPAPGVARLRYSPDGVFPPEDPFAVLPAAPPPERVERSSTTLTFDVGDGKALIDLATLRAAFVDAQGRRVSADEAAPSFDGARFSVRKAMPEDEHYFGLGDKTGPLDRLGRSFTLWNTDQFGWQESSDPLYKSVPFVLALRAGRAYGVFLDDTYRSRFDFGSAERGVWSFGAEGGPLDYYFIFGPAPKAVLERFTALVGRAPLPPLFALGYQQCRYSYYPEARVREVASEFRKRRIPADVLYLDIDYQKDNAPFTIDRERFPRFEGMIRDLGSEGFKVVAITDLHLAKSSSSWPSELLVKNPDGTVYAGRVWPGDAVFPDFTRAAARAWWGTLYKGFAGMGVRGFWNDMNEPAIFERADKTMPLDTVHSFEGRLTDHREAHNVYGMENARATYEGLLKLSPEQRPFVLTRAAFAGAQRYAATWTGDNSATWNHMRLSTPQLINLGLSGMPLVGDDIGGFWGSPSPELLTRWMELGAFNPVYRNHAIKGSRDREPWVDGPGHEAIRRRYIETRYRLLPYIYTQLEQGTRTGVPLMRPVFLEHPDDLDDAVSSSERFYFGEDLLVLPKPFEFAEPYYPRLPAGDWYDYWTGRVSSGTISLDPPLETLPVYVRAGAIIPEQPLIQHVGETPKGPLGLRVYPGPDCRGELYQDDGETFAYKRGVYLRQRFTCSVAPDAVTVTLEPAEGSFKPWFDHVEIVVYAPDAPVGQLRRAVLRWTGRRQDVRVPLAR